MIMLTVPDLGYSISPGQRYKMSKQLRKRGSITLSDPDTGRKHYVKAYLHPVLSPRNGEERASPELARFFGFAVLYIKAA